MDLTYPPHVEEYREQVKAFLAGYLPADWSGVGALSRAERARFLTAWRAELVTRRMLGVDWPEQFGGGGLGLLEQAALIEEFTQVGVPLYPHPNDLLGMILLGPTLLHHGNDEQKQRFLPATLNGDIHWAQGFSEPEAGSDLFAVRTAASQVGEHLVINGQKVWQSAGLSANWLFTLVRTAPAEQRAKGLSFVLIPLTQPGVEVRGIRGIDGERELAEVFMTDATTPISNVVGGLNNGAQVALALLGSERGAGAFATSLALAVEFDRLAELARSCGALADPDIRRRLARCWTRVHVLRCVATRSLSRSLSSRQLGPESSLAKAMISEYRQVSTELAMEILGVRGTAPDGPAGSEVLRPQPLGTDAMSSTAWHADFLNAQAGTIYGGSIEIQRNTIAEQILGLPREPRHVEAARS
jgi:alkylation response protein AidB-like acyl-CoA dehydrogenase